MISTKNCSWWPLALPRSSAPCRASTCTTCSCFLGKSPGAACSEAKHPLLNFQFNFLRDIFFFQKRSKKKTWFVAMFAPVLERLRAMPARVAAWGGRRGPAGLLCVGNTSTPRGGEHIRNFWMKKYNGEAVSDWYGAVPMSTAFKPLDPPPSAMPHFPLGDCGVLDCAAPPPGTDPCAIVAPTPSEWHTGVAAASATIFEKGYIPFLIAPSTASAHAMIDGIQAVNKGDVVMLHFGALSDCHDKSPSALDDHYHPDCSVRRINERQLVRGTVQLGTRNIPRECREFRSDEKRFRYIDMNAMYAQSIAHVKDIRNLADLFVVVDMNVLDPAFAPGASRPESAGMSTRELIHLISGIRGTKILGVCLCGFDDATDRLTALAATKILNDLVIKAYNVSTLTSKDLEKNSQDKRAAGNYPERFPEGA